MKHFGLAIFIGLTLTACGGSDTPPEKSMTTKELVAAAAVGDKDAMRELERQTAEKARVEKKKMDTMAGEGDPLALFQNALMSEGDSEGQIEMLAKNGNPNAILWRALSARDSASLPAADKEVFRNKLLKLAESGKKYKYAGIAGETYPISAEAAFQISEDKLSNKGLFAQDTDGAIKYLKQSAQDGHGKAMFKLAMRYQYALDMDKDLAEAKSWLEKSAKAGNHDATRELANWKD